MDLFARKLMVHLLRNLASSLRATEAAGFELQPSSTSSTIELGETVHLRGDLINTDPRCSSLQFIRERCAEAVAARRSRVLDTGCAAADGQRFYCIVRVLVDGEGVFGVLAFVLKCTSLDEASERAIAAWPQARDDRKM